MITKDMILLDIVEQYPKTEEYFRAINKEKCILCYNLFDSLESIANEFNLDLHKVLIDIKSLI